MTSHKQLGVQPFNSLYRHGFARVAVAIPRVHLADPRANTDQLLELARRGHERHAAVVLFPELSVTGYSAEDLFHQDALLEAALVALREIVVASEALRPLLFLGIPLRLGDGLFNCAAVVHRGRLLGVVPKSYLPNYREYYEKRHFRAANELRQHEFSLREGLSAPVGTDLIFSATDIPHLHVAVEICEDLWTPIPPSSFAALAGATVLCNLSASNVTIDKAHYRRLLCRAQSGRNVAAYAYAGAGYGESTTDLAWDGHGMVTENGDLPGRE